MAPIYFFACGAWASALCAETAPLSSAESLPSQVTVVDDVLVPVPRQIFDSLDKFAHSNWRAVQRPELAEWRPRPDPAEDALLLGAVIAEGFIAVEAEDATEVKSLGRAVLKLARALGIEPWALKRSGSIVENAEKGDWPAVRSEWDNVLPEVQHGMKELKSEELAQLVSLGGWLRGAAALSALVLQDRSSAETAVVRQPAMLDFFEKQLADLGGNLRSNASVARMRQGIRKIRPAMALEEEVFPRENVKAIGRACGELVTSLKGRGG